MVTNFIAFCSCLLTSEVCLDFCIPNPIVLKKSLINLILALMIWPLAKWNRIKSFWNSMRINCSKWVSYEDFGNCKLAVLKHSPAGNVQVSYWWILGIFLFCSSLIVYHINKKNAITITCWGHNQSLSVIQKKGWNSLFLWNNCKECCIDKIYQCSRKAAEICSAPAKRYCILVCHHSLSKNLTKKQGGQDIVIHGTNKLTHWKTMPLAHSMF